jgi:hypothetical protein
VLNEASISIPEIVLEIIAPILKAEGPKKSRKKTRNSSSTVLTSTPNLGEINEKYKYETKKRRMRDNLNL